MRRIISVLFLITFVLVNTNSQNAIPFGTSKSEPTQAAHGSNHLEAELLKVKKSHPSTIPFQLFTLADQDIKLNLREETSKLNSTEYIQPLELNKQINRQLLQAKSPVLTLEIQIDENRTVILDLFEKKPFANDIIIRTDDGLTHPLNDQVHYRGVVKGMKNSVAGISIFEDEIIGVISAAGLGTFNISRVAEYPEYHAIYPEEIFPEEPDNVCQTPDDESPDKIEEESANSEMKNHEDKCVRVYFETDFALFQNKGSINNVSNFVNGMFNNVNILFQNEEINTEISEIFIWTSSDPYPSSVGSALPMFRNLRQGFNGDVAHLLLLAGSGGGIAYLNTLCTSSSFGVSNINQNYNNFPNYSWNIMVITHEIGHNLGSNHTHWCGWPGGAIDNCHETEGSCSPGPPPSGGGTIMSYCHTTSFGINFNNGFGPLPGNRIRQRVGAVSCLGTCTSLCSGLNVQINVEATSCGENNGIIDVDLSNSTGSYQVDIGFGPGSESYFDNLPSGFYDVIITDDSGCNYSSEVHVDPSEGIIAESIITNTQCGLVNGALEVFVFQGDSPFSFDIGMMSNTTGVFTDLGAGGYTLVVTDAGNCTFEEDIYIEPSNPISAFAYPESTTCGEENGEVEFVIFSDGITHFIDLGDGNYSSSMVYTDLPAGTYTAQVVNELNCETFETFIIEESVEPILTAETIPGSCNQSLGSIEASLSTEPEYFVLNGNQQTSPFFDSLDAGAYQLMAVDENGCEVAIDVVLESSDSVFATLLIGEANCGLLGSITVQMPNADDFQFDLGNGFQSSPVFSDLEQGDYSVLISNSDGCESIFSASISGTDSISLDISTINTSCGLPNGHLNISASGGNGVYTFMMNGDIIEDQNLSNLEAGMYSIQVTDSIGCADVEEVIVQSSEALLAQLSTVQTSCGEANGGLSIEIVQGNEPFEFNIGQGSFNDFNIDELAPGNYTLTIVDGEDCWAEYPFSIGISEAIALNATIQNAICQEPNGVITLDVSGGSGDYIYLINGVEDNGPLFNDLMAGTYDISVSDQFNCASDTSIIVLNEGIKPDSDFTVVRDGLDITLVNNSTGQNLSYSWTFGDGNISDLMEPMHTYASSGNYQVCLIATNECGEDTFCRPVNAVDLSSCRTRDSLALVALYMSTNGTEWNTTWNLNTPMNTWFGLNFNTEGCLIRLELPSNNLDGILPNEIGELSQLIGMDFSDNHLYGSIPESLGELSALIFLNLGNNELEGTLPESFFDLASLQNIELENNQFSGTLSSRFDRFKKLRFLDLSENNFSGELPKNLYQLIELEFINLSHNQFESAISEEISNLTKLKHLFLNHNNFSGAIPSSIATLTNLEALWISNNSFSSFPELTSLQNWSTGSAGGLRIENNHLTFKDIIPNMLIFNSFEHGKYHPQEKVYRDTTITIAQGAILSLDIEVDRDIEEVEYAWFKEGELVFSFESPVLQATDLNNDFTGTYIGQLTHPDAPLLQLETYPITIIIEPSTSTSDLSEIMEVSISPNPISSQDQISLLLESAILSSDFEVRVFSMSGTLVYQSDALFIQEGANTFRFAAPTIPGLYIVSLLSPTLGRGNFRIAVY